jgi:hypothetical protein
MNIISPILFLGGAGGGRDSRYETKNQFSIKILNPSVLWTALKTGEQVCDLDNSAIWTLYLPSRAWQNFTQFMRAGNSFKIQ